MGDSGGEAAAMWPAGPASQLTGRGKPTGQRRQEFVLLDRRTELAAIDQVLGAVRSGLSRTLVLRGGPGVGKPGRR